MDLENSSICRLCLCSTANVCSLFGSNVDPELLTIVRHNVRLEIAKDDAFSKMICQQCIAKLKTIEQYIKFFRESDRKLRDAIINQSIRKDPANDSETVPFETQRSTTGLKCSQVSNDTKVDKSTCSKEYSEELSSRRRSKRIRVQDKRPGQTRYDAVGVDEDEFDCETDSADRPYNAPDSDSLDNQLYQSADGAQHTSMEADGSKHRTKRTKDKSAPRVPVLHDFKCYICNRESLGSRKALIEHLATHVDKLPYTCTQCVMETIVLTRVRTLNTHMKMHEQPIKCDYCDRRYSNAAGKYYHTHTYHLAGGAPCTVHCTICGKQYGSEAALKQHMKYHTTTLKCSKCDLVFNHPNKRRNHELTHNEDRGYECVVCKKVLQTIESYDVHLKKHSQERSYPCTLCPKKFNTSFNLILHLKVHAKNYNYRPAKSWVEHYTILSRDPMQYKCNHCDRYSTDKVNNMISHLQAHFKEYECDQCKRLFATAKQLRAHYTTHTGEKSEMCQHCGKCFSTKNNLRIHLKSHKRENKATDGIVKNDTLSAMQEYASETYIEIETIVTDPSVS